MKNMPIHLTISKRAARVSTRFSGVSQTAPSRSRLVHALVALALLAASVATFAAEKKKTEKADKGFVSMFDGKTLKGWSVAPTKAAKAWSAKDGMIVGEGDKGRSYLVYEKKDVAEFEMKFSYRFPGTPGSPGKGNSGVNIRARLDKTRKRKYQAYHADLGHVGIGKQVLGAWDFHTPGRTEHRCFRGDRLVIDENDKPTITNIKDGLTLKDIKKNNWNDVHIIAKGNNFKLYINGKLSSEFTEHLKKERRLDKGMIQLQLHDPGMVVHFRDLRIKIIK